MVSFFLKIFSCLKRLSDSQEEENTFYRENQFSFSFFQLLLKEFSEEPLQLKVSIPHRFGVTELQNDIPVSDITPYRLNRPSGPIQWKSQHMIPRGIDFTQPKGCEKPEIRPKSQHKLFEAADYQIFKEGWEVYIWGQKKTLVR